jgi:uncharacterized phage protein (TIGR02218 family)
MRTIPPALAERLASGATTLARCWRLARRDGVVLGFTDHDRPIAFDGAVHEPAAGFTAGEVPASLGLSVDTADVLGALVSPVLTDADLAGGLYDAARVELHLVDWSAPEHRLLLSVGEIGETERRGASFRAEVRSLAHVLDQERGRIFQGGCDADLGDARCKADLAAPDRRAIGVVADVVGARVLHAAGVAAVAAGRLAGGLLNWSSGPNVGLTSELRDDREENGERVLELWHPPPRPPEVGDAFVATVGCDKRFETCRDRFGNAANFRGFPHMPGTDFALSYARRGDANDGAPLA